MSKEINPHQYLEGADLLFSEKEVNAAIEGIAKQLNKDFDGDPVVLLSVMNGALYFTGQILPFLTFPVELDYVHATRYQTGTIGHSLEWIVEPPTHINGKKVLIFDDILDEGITLNIIAERCKLLGATQVSTVVLLEKLLAQDKPIKADYIGLTIEDRYVFGCGMDIHGWWRNLSAIHALKAT